MAERISNSFLNVVHDEEAVIENELEMRSATHPSGQFGNASLAFTLHQDVVGLKPAFHGARIEPVCRVDDKRVHLLFLQNGV